MYSFMVDDNSKHKKAKDVDINAVATISYSEYKNVLLNKECLRHLMNRIWSKTFIIGTYKINNISLSYVDDKIYILNNRYDGLALGH